MDFLNRWGIWRSIVHEPSKVSSTRQVVWGIDSSSKERTAGKSHQFGRADTIANVTSEALTSEATRDVAHGKLPLKPEPTTIFLFGPLYCSCLLSRVVRVEEGGPNLKTSFYFVTVLYKLDSNPLQTTVQTSLRGRLRLASGSCASSYPPMLKPDATLTE